MSSIKKAVSAISLIVVVSAFVPVLKAYDLGDSNWATTITVNEPFQVGQLTFTPGTYQFQLTPGTVSRTVVMIYSVDRARWEGMVSGINTYRSDESKRSGLTFEKIKAGQSLALESWFYSGWTRGIEFIYPNTLTSEIAQPADAVAVARLTK